VNSPSKILGVNIQYGNFSVNIIIIFNLLLIILMISFLNLLNYLSAKICNCYMVRTDIDGLFCETKTELSNLCKNTLNLTNLFIV